MERLILLSLIVITGSAICSGVEAALFSISLGKAKVLLEQKKAGAAILVKAKENMQRSIAVIVVLTNTFNIIGSMMVGLVAVDVFGSAWFGAISAVFTFLIIMFAEILPKNIGETYAIPIALFSAGPLLFLNKIFTPIIWVLNVFTRPFWRKRSIVSEEEIKILSHLGHMEGSIEADEKDMIQRVFLLNDITAKDIMTPRTVMEVLESKEKLKDIEDKVYSLPHSRIPVYERDLDNIIGICHQRDLLIALSKDQKDGLVSDFIKENLLLIVSEDIRLDDLIPLFQKQKTHIAIVTDEFRGTAGIITLEDVLEQIVGEIVDETDKVVDLRAEAKTLRKS